MGRFGAAHQRRHASHSWPVPTRADLYGSEGQQTPRIPVSGLVLIGVYQRQFGGGPLRETRSQNGEQEIQEGMSHAVALKVVSPSRDSATTSIMIIFQVSAVF